MDELDTKERTFGETEVGRRFVLNRLHDETGVSGTGIVAWGIEFPNGKTVVAWNNQISQTAVWESIDHVEAIHGHGGYTEVVWID